MGRLCSGCTGRRRPCQQQQRTIQSNPSELHKPPSLQTPHLLQKMWPSRSWQESPPPEASDPLSRRDQRHQCHIAILIIGTAGFLLQHALKQIILKFAACKQIVQTLQIVVQAGIATPVMS